MVHCSREESDLLSYLSASACERSTFYTDVLRLLNAWLLLVKADQLYTSSSYKLSCQISTHLVLGSQLLSLGLVPSPWLWAQSGHVFLHSHSQTTPVSYAGGIVSLLLPTLSHTMPWCRAWAGGCRQAGGLSLLWKPGSPAGCLAAQCTWISSILGRMWWMVMCSAVGQGMVFVGQTEGGKWMASVGTWEFQSIWFGVQITSVTMGKGRMLRSSWMRGPTFLPILCSSRQTLPHHWAVGGVCMIRSFSLPLSSTHTLLLLTPGQLLPAVVWLMLVLYASNLKIKGVDCQAGLSSTQHPTGFEQ